MVKDIIHDAESSERAPNSPWLSLHIEVVKGKIGVVHLEIQQLFCLEYSHLCGDFSLTKNKKSFALLLSLGNLHLRYIKHEDKYKTM